MPDQAVSPDAPLRRDIIAVGASAGGVTAAIELVRSIPGSVRAAILMVIHVPPQHPSVLPAILGRRGGISAKHAIDGEPLAYGRVYIAPPDRHMMVISGRVRLVRGPKENHNRPAIDPLFRSVATAFGQRVIGVILSGALDDGSAGLSAVQNAGGIAIVQNPENAAFPEMPENALRAVDPDYCVTPSEMGAIIEQLAREEVKDVPDQEPTEELVSQTADVIRHDPSSGVAEAAYSCPDCGGVLTESREGELVHYRCRVGHAYSPESLLALQSETVEEALWTAVRAMEESADVAGRLAKRATAQGRSEWTKKYEARVDQLLQSAAVVRSILQNGGSYAEEEASA